MRTRDIERDLNVPKLGDKLQELFRKYMVMIIVTGFRGLWAFKWAWQTFFWVNR